MSKEENKDLKGEERQPQSGDGQPDKKADDDIEELDDGRVALPKEELEQLREEHDNYRRATVKFRKKLKDLVSSDEEPEPKPEPESRSPGSGPVTKWDLAKRDFFRDDPEMKEHEDEMMAYYRRIDDSETVEAKVDNLERAGKLYRMDNPAKFEEGEEDEGARADLGTEGGMPTGKSRPSDEEPKKKGKRKLLPDRGTPPDKWYGDDEEE